MLTDTHAHLDFPEFEEGLPEIFARAEAAGVRRIVTIGTSVEGSRRAVALAEKHANVFAAIGIHPNAANEAGEDFIEELRALAESQRVVAMGEIGLDYHRLPSLSTPGFFLAAVGAVSTELPGEFPNALADGSLKATQAAVFEQQLELAIELGLNVIIHERDAWDDTLAILAPYAGKLRAVFHCFGKSLAQAHELREQNHLVSFTGLVTFKNAATVQQTAAGLPDGSFMVETDCPFLAPVPHRGKRCEPAHTRLVAEHIARLRGTSVDQISAQTETAANAFFRFAR